MTEYTIKANGLTFTITEQGAIETLDTIADVGLMSEFLAYVESCLIDCDNVCSNEQMNIWLSESSESIYDIVGLNY